MELLRGACGAPADTILEQHRGVRDPAVRWRQARTGERVLRRVTGGAPAPGGVGPFMSGDVLQFLAQHESDGDDHLREEPEHPHAGTAREELHERGTGKSYA